VVISLWLVEQQDCPPERAGMHDSIEAFSKLVTALADRQFEVSDEQVAQLDHYRRELWHWNEKINLTRHLTIEKFVGRDIRDSLAIEPFLEPGAHVLDVGTGGGVPGIILAIMRPDLTITLSESVAKRAVATEAISATVGIAARVMHARAEKIVEHESFDMLTVRAVARLDKILSWFEPYWNSIGQLLLVKGPAWIKERQEARQAGLLRGLDLCSLASYPLEGTESESVVLRVRRRQ
jgi:16S rRNA (guanine527-N7)-methyltransferase